MLFFAVIFLCNCDNGSKNVAGTTTKDTIKIEHDKYSETKIDSLYKWAKRDFDIQDIKINGDSLIFHSAGWFFYYPMGKYNNIESVRSKYTFFKVEVQPDTAEYEPSKLYRMTFKDSFVKFVKSDDTERIEVVYGNQE